MDISVEKTPILDVLVVRPQIFCDSRGFFTEVFRADVWRDSGLPSSFVQVNHSGSARHVVRGLHFQWDPPMGKAMRVVRGRAFLVAVDIRRDSPTLGRWYGLEASAESRETVWAPAGCARGFCALSDQAEVEYLTTGVYNPAAEGAIRWNDPDIGIDWPVSNPILSDKDAMAPTLREWLARPESAAFTC